MKELNTNNSKKLIIGVSMLFCAVFLIIGGTLAYFTQSDTKNTGNIVTTDINGALSYSDNDDYMYGSLIPIKIDDVDKAYTREGNLKCIDDYGYNVCSIYQFTITNNADVSQNILIDLYPVINSFNNLRFNLYDITNKEKLISNKELKLDDKTNITLDNIILDTKNNKSNIYELVFYIENQDYAQNDAGKNFGATIKVNSVTTGYNIVKDLGTGCWKVDENDSTILSEFTGFDENNEVIKECKDYMYKDTDGYYIVNVPSTYGGYTFKSLGPKLFYALDYYNYDEETGEETIEFNEYAKIKSITINDGIERIENEYEDDSSPLGFISTFAMVGLGIEESNIYLNVTLPNSLKNIGDGAFRFTKLNYVNIPSNVETIGIAAFSRTLLNSITIPKNVKTISESAFGDINTLEKVTFETDDNGNSSLESIGDYAFSDCNLNYQDRNYPLIIPKNIISIGEKVFGYSDFIGFKCNLHYIKYTGTNQDILNNSNNWYNNEYVKELITTD